ncbi:MAG: dihydroorotate dehydrogenase electron transfer subunit [Christensenellaceae bacterium]|nr:dihydroorotate dehydrogenase electron transfer subunit [Christensenellaceae bacterium]
MIQSVFDIISNIRIAKDTFKLVLRGDTSDTAAGRFINIKLDGFFLRRPISVCDYDDDTITVIYKTVGKGTRYLAGLEHGTLDVLSGLGNGFALDRAGKSPLLVGGGAGVSPMFALAKRVKNVTAVLGFNTKDEVYLKEEFEQVCDKVIVTTVDGSMGVKGFVTDAIKELETPSYYYACGPEPMLKAVFNAVDADGELSFEERMACGFGVCRGCTCKTKYGDKSICKDGPVMRREEIIW